MRVFHNQSVGVWNIYAGFDDGCGDQYVDLSVNHLLPDTVQIVFVHLTVCVSDIQFRQCRMQDDSNLFHIFHTIMQPEYLSAAPYFGAHSFNENAFFISHHVCLDRYSVTRRFIQYTHVSDPAHCHVQGTRDRCSCQRQHIYVLRECFQFFLLTYPETLFFINNQKSEVMENDIFGYKPMRAYHNVNFPASQAADNLLLL